MKDQTDKDITTEVMLDYLDHAHSILGFAAVEAYAGVHNEAEIATHHAIVSRLQDYDRLIAEVREWICESCHYVYPGPPQQGLSCIVCPKCQGRTIPKGLSERDALKSDNDTLRIDLANATERAKKLEDDVERLNKRLVGAKHLLFGEDAEKAEAKLERARPLLDEMDDILGQLEAKGRTWPIFRAKLNAYREGKAGK